MFRKRSLLAASMLAALATAAPVGAETWQPVASDKLVRLPANYLEKAIESDYRESALAAEVAQLESDISGKVTSMSELKSAIARAEGPVRTELQHQFLVKKRDYIAAMGARIGKTRQMLDTKVRLYENLLAKLNVKNRNVTPAQEALMETQQAARARFESGFAEVDMKLFGSPLTSESKYGEEYAKNIAAIESLVEAIKAHPMNTELDPATAGRDKAAYLQGLIADAQADLAIATQEENILGYMAKLVALDAMALSETVLDQEMADGAPAGTGADLSLSSVTDMFTGQ